MWQNSIQQRQFVSNSQIFHSPNQFQPVQNQVRYPNYQVAQQIQPVMFSYQPQQKYSQNIGQSQIPTPQNIPMMPIKLYSDKKTVPFQEKKTKEKKQKKLELGKDEKSKKIAMTNLYQLKEAKNVIQQPKILLKEKEDLEKKNQKINKQNELENENKQLKIKLENNLKKENELLLQIEQSNKSIQDQEKENNKLQNIVVSELQELKEQFLVSQKELQDLKEENSQLKSQLEENKIKENTLQDELKKYQLSEENAKTLVQIQEQNNQKDKEIATLKEQLESSKTKSNDLNEQIIKCKQNSENEIKESVEQKTSWIQKILKEKEKEIAQLKQNNEMAQETIKSNQTNAVGNLQSKIQVFEDQIQSLNKNQKIYQQKEQEQYEQLTEKDKEIGFLKEQLANFQNKID